MKNGCLVIGIIFVILCMISLAIVDDVLEGWQNSPGYEILTDFPDDELEEDPLPWGE